MILVYFLGLIKNQSKEAKREGRVDVGYKSKLKKVSNKIEIWHSKMR